jgi:hypothetical protein
MLTATTSVNNTVIFFPTFSDVLTTSDTENLDTVDGNGTNITVTEYPGVITPNNSFTLDGGDAVTVAINTAGGDCLFAGHFMNVAD